MFSIEFFKDILLCFASSLYDAMHVYFCLFSQLNDKISLFDKNTLLTLNGDTYEARSFAN